MEYIQQALGAAMGIGRRVASGCGEICLFVVIEDMFSANL
jgi:hypothetical protein